MGKFFTITNAVSSICFGADRPVLRLFQSGITQYHFLSSRFGAIDGEIMVDQRLMKLTLGKGASQRVLVEARTTVLVVSGHVVLRGPLSWRAENVITLEQRLFAEQSLVVDDGGWIDLLASDHVELMLLPPEGDLFWQRVGRCLSKLFENGQHGQQLATPTQHR